MTSVGEGQADTFQKNFAVPPSAGLGRLNDKFNQTGIFGFGTFG